MAYSMLFVTDSTPGHLNPFLAAAAALEQRGHRVRWMIVPHADTGSVEAPSVVAERYEVIASGLSARALWGSDGPAELVVPQVTEPGLKALHKMMYIRRVKRLIAPLVSALSSANVDLVVTDGTLYAVHIAAHKVGLPVVSLSTHLLPLLPHHISIATRTAHDQIKHELNAMFVEHGLPGDVGDLFYPSALLNLFLISEKLASVAPLRDTLPAHTAWMGFPAPHEEATSFPWQDLRDDRSLVYVSFGSETHMSHEMIRKVVDAAPDTVQLAIRVPKCASRQSLGPVPDSAIIVDWAPQRTLLERAAVFVTHGGANSIGEALWAATPMLISPVWRDQPGNAWLMQKVGLGLALDLQRASVEETREALAALLRDDAPERAAVQKMSRAYRSRDGGQRAAELIEGIAGAGKGDRT